MNNELKIDQKTDPYIRRWVNEGLTFNARYGWHFEAIRRHTASGFSDVGKHIPYFLDEETFGWSSELLDTLADMPTNGLENCEFDPNGPGAGVHVWGDNNNCQITDMALGAKHMATGRYFKEDGDEETYRMKVLRIDKKGRCHMLSEPAVFWSRYGATVQEKVNALRKTKHIFHDFDKHELPLSLRIWPIKVQALLRQRILEVDNEVPSNRVIRQGRLTNPNIDMSTPVKVVHFRKSINGVVSDSGDPLDRKVHWMVSGHWKNQPYGPENSKRKAIFILPHVKGNLDGPLYKKPVVNLVDR